MSEEVVQKRACPTRALLLEVGGCRSRPTTLGEEPRTNEHSRARTCRRSRALSEARAMPVEAFAADLAVGLSEATTAACTKRPLLSILLSVPAHCP